MAPTHTRLVASGLGLVPLRFLAPESGRGRRKWGLCVLWLGCDSGKRGNWFLSPAGKSRLGVPLVSWNQIILGAAKPSGRGPWVSLHETPCPAALVGEKPAPALSGGSLIPTVSLSTPFETRFPWGWREETECAKCLRCARLRAGCPADGASLVVPTALRRPISLWCQFSEEETEAQGSEMP